MFRYSRSNLSSICSVCLRKIRLANDLRHRRPGSGGIGDQRKTCIKFRDRLVATRGVFKNTGWGRVQVQQVKFEQYLQRLLAKNPVGQ